MQDETTIIRPRWYWNIPIVLLVGILGSLGVRGLVLDDARYSWGTFCKQITYRIEYRWIRRRTDGKLEATPHSNYDELRGDAKKHLAGNSKYLNTRYSLGAVESWMAAYVRYMYENRDAYSGQPPEGEPAAKDEIVGFTAEAWYRVNTSRTFHEPYFARLAKEGKYVPPRQQLFFSYPPPRGTTKPRSVKEYVRDLNQTDVKDDDE